MEACAEAGIEFVVLDRPNPLGGERIEGPMLERQFRSHVGYWNVPYVYGLTCGELARMINGEGWIKQPCRLTVVRMKGWKRSMVWRDTDLPWVPSSPHVPHGDSALFQVATGMLGELNSVSIGIGYTLPFECIAAPGLDPHKFAEQLNNYHLPGVKFQPITYKPYYFTFTNQVIAFLYLALIMGGLPTTDLYLLPELIDQTIRSADAQLVHLEQLLYSWNDTYCLGYGSTYPIALEGALKLKEVTDIHCEGLLSTEFKHGPLAAVRDGYPIIFIAGSEDVPLIISGINEVACRGARTVVIAEDDSRLEAITDAVITIPRTGPIFNPILSIIPMQLLAYRISVSRGFDPDYPRNLSKTLTVD